MPSRKTHRCKTHRRKTHRNIKKGGRTCQSYEIKHDTLLNKIIDIEEAAKEGNLPSVSDIDELVYEFRDAIRAAQDSDCEVQKRKLLVLQNRRLYPIITMYSQNGGGGCESLRARFEALKKRVHLIRMATYENKHSKVRELYNDAMRIKNEASKNSCEALAREIDEFENTILRNQTIKLHERR